MRLIKFRIRFNGKIAGYEWLEDGAWKWYAIELDIDKDGNLLRTHQGTFPTGFKLEREQFIGVKDQAGKEIYVGDTVKWYINDYTRTAPVGFDEETASFWMLTDPATGHLVLNDWLRGEYEILETPELSK